MREGRAPEGRRGPTTTASSLRHLEDRPADAELGRDDRIAGGERRGLRERLVGVPDRPPRARGTIGGGSESAIALTLLRRRGGSGGTPPLPLELPRGADLDAEPFELGARVGQLALREGDRPVALRLGRGADALDLLLELGDPGLCGSARLLAAACSLAALALASAARPSAASASARSSATRSRSGVTWARASATSSGGRPRRSAIRSAWDVPARPSATRYSGSSVSGSNPVAALATPSVDDAHSFSSA